MMAAGAANKKCDGCGGICHFAYNDPDVKVNRRSCSDCCFKGRGKWKKRSLFIEGGSKFPDSIWCEVCHSVVATGGSTMALYHCLHHPDIPASVKAMGWTRELLQNMKTAHPSSGLDRTTDILIWTLNAADAREEINKFDGIVYSPHVGDKVSPQLLHSIL